MDALPRQYSGKEYVCQCREQGFDPWVEKILWGRKWKPTSVFLPGEFHGKRNLVGYSSWDRKESDTAERLNSFPFTHSPNYLHYRQCHLSKTGNLATHHYVYCTRITVVDTQHGIRVCVLSCVTLFATQFTVSHQVPLSVEFPRQEYWSEVPFPSAGVLPHPGIEPASYVSPALAGGFFTTVPPGKLPACYIQTFMNQSLAASLASSFYIPVLFPSTEILCLQVIKAPRKIRFHYVKHTPLC